MLLLLQRVAACQTVGLAMSLILCCSTFAKKNHEQSETEINSSEQRMEKGSLRERETSSVPKSVLPST